MKIVISDKSGQVLYEGVPNLHENGVIIGTGNNCDIQINKIGIARQHIQLRYNADGYLTLQDLQSPFGTIVNGKKIQPGFLTTVSPGTYVELSEDVFLHLQIESEDEMSGPSEPNKIFPFFMNSNEQYVRKVFSKVKTKIPRAHYSALTAAEGELITKIKELSAIIEVTFALNSITSFHRLLEFTLEMALAVTGAERGYISLYNPELKRLETVVAKNFPAKETYSDFMATSGLINKVFETGQPLVGPSHNFQIQGRRGKQLTDSGIMSIGAVPLKELSSIIGVLYVDTKNNGNILSSRTEQLMQVFAAQAAVAINKARMFHNATTDGQTQLGNKKFFMQRLTEEFCRAQRHQKPISLILMDIDFFHKINEGYGDHNGDKVLREAGNIFRQTTRVHDLVARFGPDSFAMLLPETEAAGAKIVAQKLKDALSQTVIRVDNKSIQVTASFGIGASTRSTEKASDLLKYAEKAIKQAQRKGGNQIA